MALSAISVAVRGIGGSAISWATRGWGPAPSIAPPPEPPPPYISPRPKKRSRTIVARRGGGGGGGGSDGAIRLKRRHRIPDDLARLLLDQEASKVDYALMNVTGGATVRALADGLVTHFHDARGRLALKLTADDGTNYYYADLSSYVGTSRRVKSGEAVANSAREATPEIAPPKMLPETTGQAARLRTVAPVFVEPPADPIHVKVLPARRYVMLVPIAKQTNEWLTTSPTTSPMHPIVGAALITGALAAFLFALIKLDRPKRKRRKKR